jgi:hypothetical protein
MHSSRIFQPRLLASPFLFQVSRSRLGLVIAGLVVLGIALFATAGLALAQTTPSAGPNAAAEGLTHTLVTLSARYQLADSAEQPRLLRQLLTVAAGRQQLLGTLIEDNPAEVLRLAVPAHLRASLPPAVQDYVEEEVELEGVLEVLHEDSNTGSRYLYFLEVAGQRFSLHFSTEPPDLLSDSRVRVRGVRIKEALALGSGRMNVQTLAAALPNTFGAQSTLVMLVNFQDNPTQPYTLNDAWNVLFGTTSDFFLENSYEQTWLTGDVVGWYTIPLNSTSCNSGSIATYAEAAATAAGVNLSAYTHRVYAFPAAACGFSGAATVGGNPSRTWINGSDNMSLETVGHELGHNLGLLHSHSLVCDDGMATMTGSCSTLEYGDGLDIMGWSASGHFNAFQKERLGWLNYGASPSITTITSSGTYYIAPYESPGTNPKALKILKRMDTTTGAREWYYVEYRQAIGFDSYLATVSGPYQLLSSNILNGVEIRWVSESSVDSSRLLDMTPGSVDPYTGIVDLYTNDPALTAGNSFSDPDVGVTLTVTPLDSRGAVVSVTLTAPTCARADPTIAVSPSPGPAVPAGTAVTYTVSVTNNDGAGCAASSFSLQTMMLLNGWTAEFSVPTLTLSPGAGTSTTFTVTSPASATTGTYSFPVTVTNSMNASYAATGSAIYVIGSVLNVSVSTDKPSYTVGQTISVTARATSGGSPVSNASVTFTMTKSDGTVVSQTATTDPTGAAVGKFRLKRQDPAGGYKARADVVKMPLSGSAVTSFTVVK